MEQSGNTRRIVQGQVERTVELALKWHLLTAGSQPAGLGDGVCYVCPPPLYFPLSLPHPSRHSLTWDQVPTLKFLGSSEVGLSLSLEPQNHTKETG